MDEDDLTWVANENKILLLLKQFHEHFRFKKLSHSSDMKNDALMHRVGLKLIDLNFHSLPRPTTSSV